MRRHAYIGEYVCFETGKRTVVEGYLIELSKESSQATIMNKDGTKMNINGVNLKSFKRDLALKLK